MANTARSAVEAQATLFLLVPKTSIGARTVHVTWQLHGKDVTLECVSQYKSPFVQIYRLMCLEDRSQSLVVGIGLASGPGKHQ